MSDSLDVALHFTLYTDLMLLFTVYGAESG
jgi:hypothetical protein